MQRQAGQAQLLVRAPEQLDDLGVDRGVAVADCFGAELVVLPVAAGLWPVVAEVGHQVPEADGLRLVVHPVLEIGAADGRSALRPQRELLLAAVLEHVHLFLHDVRRVAEPRVKSEASSKIGVSIAP